MNLKLLIDEDSQGKILVDLLGKAGYDVLTVNKAGLRTASDQAIFNYAISHKRAVLTQNSIDFAEIASILLEQGKHHKRLQESAWPITRPVPGRRCTASVRQKGIRKYWIKARPRCG